ncbi:pectate lyase [Neiella marina]|uniref:Pectate lyase n=1 Tax=Neiella holothuriorum TaxID=2870530 RepID=A0ABS7EDS1_9GAMM|nr:pectate lyase [Neiella holothuriorum]MBW8190487.1 pectate lyase [Neiella holothuriorum]
MAYANQVLHYPAPQTDIAKLLNKYRSIGKLKQYQHNQQHIALNLLTWQLDNGGFSTEREAHYAQPWDGVTAKTKWMSQGVELATIDDGATIAELRFLAQSYDNSNAAQRQQIKSGFTKGLDWLLKAQHPTGSWPQVYPLRHHRPYSNLATFNDHAIIRVMVLFADILTQQPPFKTDLVPEEYNSILEQALERGVEFIIASQISNDGQLTIWPAQLDPISYTPKQARAYEFPSKSSRESVGILAFLMNYRTVNNSAQNRRINQAIDAGIRWLKENRKPDLYYDKPKGMFISRQGSSLWYRFYEVDNNQYFFADRDGKKKLNISDVSMERRTGYSWAGDFASKLIAAYEQGAASPSTPAEDTP